jgi:hypothetical protein
MAQAGSDAGWRPGVPYLRRFHFGVRVLELRAVAEGEV